MGGDSITRKTEDAGEKTDSREYLKHVSRIKHGIYTQYLGAWIGILSRTFNRLRIFDCFAGDGRYVDEAGQPLPGSPQRAIEIASKAVEKEPSLSVTLGFIERDSRKAQRLKDDLDNMSRSASVSYRVFNADAREAIQRILTALREKPGTVPTFFFVDPFGYPLSIPVMRDLLSIPKAEILVNVMSYRLIMDLGNRDRERHFNSLFGHENWKAQPFNLLTGEEWEQSFLDYFEREVGREYIPVRLPMPYSPEDNVPLPENRRKYYLVHFSSHPRAARVMKEIMDRAQKPLAALRTPRKQGLFDFADPAQVRALARISDLKQEIRERFRPGTRVTFDDLLNAFARSRYSDRECKQAVKELEGKALNIDRRESKRTGLREGDILIFI